MGRISTKYNYRIRKNGSKSKPPKIEKLNSTKENVVIKKKDGSTEKIKVRNGKVNKKTPDRIPKNKNFNIRKKGDNVDSNGLATIQSLQDYISDKKVLVVGNSQDTTTQKYGSQIDSYDIVVRMNFGIPLSKYKVHMGEKINIWSHGILSHKSQIMVYRKICGKIDYHIETCERKFCKTIANNKSFLIKSDLYKDEFDRKNNCEMSTGLNTLIFFVDYLKTMKEISIVGFNFLRQSNHLLKSCCAKWHKPDLEEKTITELLLGSGKYIPFNEKYIFEK